MNIYVRVEWKGNGSKNPHTVRINAGFFNQLSPSCLQCFPLNNEQTPLRMEWNWRRRRHWFSECISICLKRNIIRLFVFVFVFAKCIWMMAMRRREPHCILCCVVCKLSLRVHENICFECNTSCWLCTEAHLKPLNLVRCILFFSEIHLPFFPVFFSVLFFFLSFLRTSNGVLWMEKKENG